MKNNKIIQKFWNKFLIILKIMMLPIPLTQFKTMKTQKLITVKMKNKTLFF